MRAAPLAAGLALAAVALAGCAGAPRPGVPVERARLEELAAAVARADARGPVRATGTGTLVLGTERRDFSFALVYDPPAWLRVDVRPALGSLSGPSGVAALLSGDTLTAHAPASDRWVAGRLRDLVPGIDRIDVASFIVGRPSPGLLLALSHARATRDSAGVVLSGDVRGREMTVAVDTTALTIREIDVRLGDATQVTVRYERTAGAALGPAPAGAEFRYADARGVIELDLAFDGMRALSSVDRHHLALAAPPGSVVDLRDLSMGRQP